METGRPLTMRREIFLLGFLFLALVSLLFTGVFLRILYRNGMQSAKNSLRQCNSQIVTYAEGMFHESAALLRILAADDLVRHGDKGRYEEVMGVFEDICRANANITYVYAGYRDGSLFIDDYPTPEEYNATVRPWYIAAMQAEGVTQLVYRDAVTSEWLFSQCMRLQDDRGSTTGVVCICLAMGLLLTSILQYRFARPIVELGGRIRCLAEGEPLGTRNLRFTNAEISGIAQDIELLVLDIASREERRKAAEFLSFHDSMTGLYNRRFFEEELLRLDVKRNWPLCLVCCDVNGLKLVNDVFGHAVGDRLIDQVAWAMEKSCRADDILARIGGDEFAVILPHTGVRDAEMVIGRIRENFPKEGMEGAWVSASLGYAAKTEPDQSPDDVMRAADEMMYAHKTLEGEDMRRRTVNSIIAAAEREGLVSVPATREELLLNLLGTAFCPDAIAALKEGYRLRQIGLCSLVRSSGGEGEARGRHHTETGYRILSALEEYRGVAGYVLHYQEHWDGSGWPAGRSGQNIPMPARIIAVVEAACRGAGLKERTGQWYDPALVEFLAEREG